jgi:hypothetical protein
VGRVTTRRIMAKKRMIVYDDQLMVDMDLVFNAIREADGDWKKVEEEMRAYLAAIQNTIGNEE